MTAQIFRAAGARLEFVGDFDGLYREQADPWGQSGAAGPLASYYAASRCRLGMALLRYLSEAGERIEIGCGHGHALVQLNHAVRGGRWHGLDISPEAIAQAEAVYPQFEFHVGDIAGELSGPLAQPDRFDAVILNQMLWYVLERIEAAIGNCMRMVRPGGLVVISQAFLRGPQRFGADIADGFQGAMTLFADRFPGLRLIEAQFDDSGRHHHQDGLLVFRRIA